MDNDENEIQILQNAKSRFIIAEEALRNPVKVQLNSIFNEIKRENEFLAISRLINPNFNKGCANN